MELFGTNNPKKGAEDVTAGEKLLPGLTGQKEDAARRAFKEKERDAPLGYSGRTALRREQCDVFALWRAPPLPPAMT
jgi:hypothetical protein